MIIDTHTHVFPDAIASRAVENLKKMADIGCGKEDSMTAYTDGTLDGLKRSMAQNGVDASLVLPVATKPSQFDSINEYAARINGKDGIYSFGGIHPDCQEPEKKLDYIKSLGLRGIKLHPAYQQCSVDDPRYLRIVRHCLEIGLYVVFHSGYDIAYPGYTPCTPELFSKSFAPLLKEFSQERDPRIILAHLGGVMELDQTLEYLVGLPVYLDLAYTFEQPQCDKIMRIINAHGAHRILFASDSPWQDQGKCIECLRLLPLDQTQLRLILSENAKPLLSF